MESLSVFVDTSGRRSRTFRRFGWAVTIVCACYATTVAASLVGGSSGAPFLRIPGVVEGAAQAAEAEGGEAAVEQPSWEPTIPNGTLPADWGTVAGVVPPSTTADPAEPAGPAGEGAASDAGEEDRTTDATGAVAPGKSTAGGPGADTAATQPAPGATPPAGSSAGSDAGTPPADPQDEAGPPADEPQGNGNPIDGLLGGLLGLPPLLGG